MSRRALAIVVGTLGFAIGALSLVGLLIMGSLFADARTDKITGPGVDVFVKTPFPLEGGHVILDVEARGGSRAGVNTIVVRAGTAKLVETKGDGATWGSSFRKDRNRGSDTVRVEFAVPPTTLAGQTLALTLDVSYVVAMSSGSSFENNTYEAELPLDIAVHSPGTRTFAQTKQIGAALFLFGLWLLVALGVTKLYAAAAAREPFTQASEFEGYALLMGMVGGGIVGYWLFALRITNAVEIDSLLVESLLMIAWIVIPLLGSWWYWRRLDAKN